MTLFARALLPIWLAPAIVCLVGRARPHPAPAAVPGLRIALALLGGVSRCWRSAASRSSGGVGRETWTPCRRGSAQPCSPDNALFRHPMTATTPQTSGRTSRLTGYLLALAAGATWGTTGPLSTGLYGLMPATSIGFWRVLLGTVCLALWGLAFRRELFRVDRGGWLLVGLGGGCLVALFEVAYQYAIAGAGVAGAARCSTPRP